MTTPRRFPAGWLAVILMICLSGFYCSQEDKWQPVVDWGHWRLGHRSNAEFLEQNQFTLTFGSGAPNFEYVTRAEFDSAMAAARSFNDSYHDNGYIVLRYLSTSLNGESMSNKDQPQKEQIQWLKFYNESWQDFEDYIGPKPEADPTSWITVHADDSFPHYRYAPYGRETDEGFETWGCPDNPDYVRMMEGRIRAQAETGIDGSYVDWTHIAGGTCYCDYTHANFIRYLQKNLPAEVGQQKYGISDYGSISLPRQRGDDFWMEWITYRGHVVAEFHKKLRTVARKYNPTFLISGNIFGGFGYGPIAYDAAGNIEMLGREGYDDFIYSEIQEFLDTAPRKDKNGTKISNGPALKFLAAASHNKPVIVYATEITPPIFPNPTEKCLSAMAQINIAEAAANHAIFREKRETPPGATKIHRFLAEHEQHLLGAKLHSNIAVVSSLTQYLADELSFAFSTSRVLADNGIAHVMMVEDDLLSDVHNQFELIILPYLPLLSSAKQQALVKYVETGGRLLILGNSGHKNEYNVAHSDIALTSLFPNNQYPVDQTVQDRGNGRVCFLPLEIPEHKFLIPSKEKGVYTTFGPTMADLFADIPEGYTRDRINPELRTMLQQVADRSTELLTNSVTRLRKAMPYLEITTMRNSEGNKVLVHLVNYDVTLDGDIIPVKNPTVQMVLPEGKTLKRLLYSGSLNTVQPAEFKTVMQGTKQIISFSPDIVEIYGLAIAELN